MRNSEIFRKSRYIFIVSLFLCLLLLINIKSKGQYFTESEFSNEFILKNKVGKQYSFFSEDRSVHNVVVKWTNGYYVIGQIRIVRNKEEEERYPQNYWYLYDDKGRLREVFNFSGFDCPVVHKVFKKNGELKSEWYSSPCL